MKGKSLIGVILAAICVTVTYLLPGSEELSHEGITALGVLGMASILWISNTLPFGVTGLLALVMLVLLGVSDMASVFVGFSNSSVIFVITVFCLTAAVMNTKLTLRLMQIYTSGTTSIPKGVMLSDNAICSHALGHLTDICQTGNSVYMCVLPLFHASSSGAIATLIAGATVVVLERFRPKVYLKTIEKYKATALSLTPSMFSALLDEIDEGSYDLTSVKSVIYGAEPILAKYIRKANEKLGCDFYQLFGMSEMGPVITLLRAEDHRAKDDALLEKRLKSVGKVALGAKIKIVAPDGSKCPVGRQGEIYAQGLGQMMCYYNAPDKTASVFSDGWYHTGDVGYLDEDNYLYLVGRMSDMIISGGENVYPKSVEECILALDGVENVAVVGLKDDHLGEAVTAVIVKAPGAELDEATVRNWCKGKIAGFMKPRKVFFVNELPVNSTGKIDKRKLTEMFN